MARNGRTHPLGRAGRAIVAALLAAAALAAVGSAASPSWNFGPAGGGSGELGSHVPGVAVAADGTVYVPDRANGEVDVYRQSGGHAATWSGFDAPSAVAVAGDGRVLVADAGGVRAFAPDGSPQGTLSEVGGATGLAVGLGGALVVADGGAGVVRIGDRSFGDFDALSGVAVAASGDVFVADGGRVHRYSWEGARETTWPTGHALGVAVAPDGGVLVAEGTDHRVGAYDADGRPLRGYGDGMNVVSGVAADCRGSVYAVDNSDPRGHVFAAPGSAPPPCVEPPRQEVLPEVVEPLPELGKSGRASVVDGTVWTGRGAGRRRIDRRRIVPVGTPIDTSEGTVKLEFETAPGPDRQRFGRFMEGTFSDGEFTPHQGGDDSLVELHLEGSGVGAGTSLAQASAKKRRRVWSTGRGRFRTVGRHGAATVRGTRWLTEDRADGTFVSVTEGSVSVRVFATGETHVVGAGESFLARKACESKRRFWIRLRIPVGTAVDRVAVRIKGRRAPIRLGRRVRALVDLRGMPEGKVPVRIRVRLGSGETLTGTRIYETCTPKKPGGAPPRL